MAALKVYNGSTWATVIGKIYDGASWEEKMNFWDGSAWVELYPTGPAAVVTLSGETITDQGAGDRLYRATVRVDNDGKMYKFVNQTVTQIDSGTDWIIPNGDASSSYEVKYDKTAGDNLDGSTTLNEGVWGALGADKFFECRHAAGLGIGQHSTTITISIRKDGGAVLDSASYVLLAKRLF